MKPSSLSPILLFTLGACTLDTVVDATIDVATPLPPAKLVRTDHPIPGRYIVVLDTPKDALAAGAMNVAAIARDLGRGQLTVRATWSRALKGFAAEMSDADARAMADDPRVAFVQEDGWVEVSATQTGATWGLDRIDQPALPLDGTFTAPSDGQGVTAYVIDSGIRVGHPDFEGRARPGFSAIDDGRGTDDCLGHGSHVAGTIGSATWGVAKRVDLVAVRVLGCDGTGAISGVIAGIDWVAQHHQGPSVANLSLSGPANPAEDAAVQSLIAAGVTTIVAAGNNDGQDACGFTPARVTEAITVAASGMSDAAAPFSNLGACVDLFAPGVDILSVDAASAAGSRLDSGTSMASPHVAGAAALYLAAHPSAAPAEVAAALLAAATPDRISAAPGTANRLLNVRSLGGGGGGGGQPPPGAGSPAHASSDLTVWQGQWIHYQPLPVVAGTRLTATLIGVGDPDLFVRFGGRPNAVTYHCASVGPTADERCDLLVPAGAADVFVGVYGYRDAAYHLEVDWVAP